MGTSPIPTEMLRTPPLGGTTCPDGFWNGGRALYLSGPQTFLGALQILTASLTGQPASSMEGAPIPVPPPGVAEGSLPFADVDGTIVLAQPPEDQGATAFVEET